MKSQYSACKADSPGYCTVLGEQLCDILMCIKSIKIFSEATRPTHRPNLHN